MVRNDEPSSLLREDDLTTVTDLRQAAVPLHRPAAPAASALRAGRRL